MAILGAICRRVAPDPSTVVILDGDADISRQVNRNEPVFLLVKVTQTLGTALSEATVPPSDKQARRILKTEHVKVDDQRVLVIDDTQHNTLTVVFSGQLHFLALDSQKQLIQLDMPSEP